MDNIRPIKTEADYDWAIAEVTKYFENEPDLGTPDGDRFDVLSSLIEAYEDKHYSIKAPDPVAAIAAHMEFTGFTQKTFAELLGSRSRASEILSRKRPLTMDMAHKIYQEWRIPAEVLIQPYHLANEDRGKVRKRA